VNGSGDRPSPLPEHPYFQVSSGFDPLPIRYRHFGGGRYHASYWMDGGASGVNLLLPRVKNDDHYWHAILFVDWLCGFSRENACIGMFQQESALCEACLLFSFNRKLKMYIGNDKRELDASKGIL
jgi:hypothetical protein